MSSEVEKDWTTEAGLRAVVLMTYRGHRCGYVGVPEGHPLFGVGYGDICESLAPLTGQESVGHRGAISLFCMAATGDLPQTPEAVFDVHGSLTFADHGREGGSLDPGLWWFGFDCAHCGDAPSPEYIARMRAEYPYSPYMWSDHGGVHRTLDYCVEHCESLARQIVERTRAAATLRQAARGPQFASADELAHWLESLHECDSNGSVGSRKWEAAQVAARAVRGMGSQAARVDEGMVERAREAYHNHAIMNGLVDQDSDYIEAHEGAMRAALEAALSAQPAERQGEDFEAWFSRQDSRTEWRELVRMAYFTRPAAPVGVPDGMVLDAEDWAVLRRLRRALPDVGLNGWHRGVTVLDKVLAAAPSAPQGVDRG